MNTFSPVEAIKYGWTTFKTNPSFLIKLFLIVFALEIGLSMLSPKSTASNWPLVMLISIPTTIVSMIISLGMINTLLKFVATGKASFSDLFSEFTNFKLVINYIIGSIIVGLIVIGGLILLIIPGLYFAIRLNLFVYYIVDKNLGYMEAVKASWSATKGNVLNLMIFGTLSLGVILLGLLALIVGLLVAIPVISLAGIYVYKKISQQGTQAAAPAESTPIPQPTVEQPVTPAV